MIRPPLRLGAAVFLTFAACSRCSQKRSTPTSEISRYLSTNAEVIVSIPDLEVIGERLSALEKLKIANFVSQVEGYSTGHDLVTELLRQFGVDLRRKEEIQASGIDPKLGAGVVVFGDDDGYLVVAIKETGRFEDFLTNLARTRLGLGFRATSSSQRSQIVTFSVAQGTSPRLGYVLKDGLAFVASSKSIPHLSEWPLLPESQSLVRNATHRASLARLGANYDLSCFFPESSTLSQRLGLAGITVLSSLGPPQLLLRADAPIGAEAARFQALQLQSGPDLTSFLPADAFLIARFQGNPTYLEPVWPKLLGPYVERAVRASGFNLKSEVLDNLKPGLTASLSLAPDARLGGGIPQLDIRRTNPFGFFHLVAIGELRDEAKAIATLEKIPAVAQQFGAQVTREKIKGKQVYLSSYSQGEGAHFGMVSNKVFMASPQSRLESALDALDGKSKATSGAPADPDLKRSLTEGAFSVVLDLQQLANSVRALPAEAWGLGGFAIKTSVVRWLEATNDLRAITLNTSSKDGAVQLVLTLRLARQ